MPSLAYLVVTYAIVGLGLALYVLALRRRRAELSEELAAPEDEQADLTEPER